jgi:hypothetical protein
MCDDPQFGLAPDMPDNDMRTDVTLLRIATLRARRRANVTQVTQRPPGAADVGLF